MSKSMYKKKELVEDCEEKGMAEAKTMSPNQQRLCDYCSESTALLYCRADSAKLCFSCDREVHSTNQLFSKHTRSHLCDACDSSPASIFCETERSVLCQNCDWERHNLEASEAAVHSRRPVEGFTGCPSVCELLSIVGLEDADLKALSLAGNGGGVGEGGFVGSGPDGFSDMFIWDTPTFVNLDDLIASTGSDHNFQAMGVPPLPKNRNASCGHYKDEMLLQLSELSKLEPVMDGENMDCKPDIQSLSCGKFEKMFVDTHDDKPSPSYEVGTFRWSTDSAEAMNQVFQPSTFLRSYREESSVVPDKSSDFVGSVSHDQDNHEEQSRDHVKSKAMLFPKGTPNELTSQERDSAISRYKEKKRTRRYDKHVRYESRKARAESRTRIKGRFAKIDQ